MKCRSSTYRTILIVIRNDMSHNLQNVVEAEREREALVYNELLVPFLALHSYEQEDYTNYVKSVEKAIYNQH